MKASAYPHMLTSFHDGWDELHTAKPREQNIFFKLVLPLSLLPVLMVLYAGNFHGAYYSSTAMGRWETLAAVFFVAEMITVPGMAWIIRQLAKAHMAHSDYDGSYLLAAVAAVPMWLSSLTLFVPFLPFNIACAVTGLVLACALVYHGIPVMLGKDRDDDVRDMTYLVMWIGVGAWAILSSLIALLFVAG
ncbi:YIP1 family protein [Andreprevotia chitinilytica]|uniref:YIP1 family protein n=1 Tax=Andreprevotia chitinilytica TaxID=396808 RepID=UPI0009FEF4F3|nr:YIP1 family protein [Andreprevotia chitinilytica]